MGEINVNFCEYGNDKKIVYNKKVTIYRVDSTFSDLATEISKLENISSSFIEFFDNGTPVGKDKFVEGYETIDVKLRVKDPCIMIIGETGVGKSSFCNLITQTQDFPESSSINSFTFQTTICHAKWVAKLPTWIDTDEHETKEEKNENIKHVDFTLLDTPGLSDSALKDTQHIENMVCKIRLVGKVAAFVLVFSGASCRLTCTLREMLELFMDMFSPSCLFNIALVFTHWAYDKKAVAKRKKAKDLEAVKISEFNKYLHELGMEAFRTAPCYFIDTQPFDREESTKVFEQLQEFTKTTFSWQPYDCNLVKAMKSCRDQLIESKNEMKDSLDYLQNKINILQSDAKQQEILENYVMKKRNCTQDEAKKLIQNNGGSCLSEDTMIKVYRSKTFILIPLKDVNIGDQVQTRKHLDTIYFTLSPKQNDVLVVNLTCQLQNKQNSSILSLTPNHLLFHEDGKLKRADSFRIGDFVQTDYDKKYAKITDISVSFCKVKNIVTFSGEFFIQNIRVSCYAGSAVYAQIMHKLATIPRIMYPISKNSSNIVCQFGVQFCNPRKFGL